MRRRLLYVVWWSCVCRAVPACKPNIHPAHQADAAAQLSQASGELAEARAAAAAAATPAGVAAALQAMDLSAVCGLADLTEALAVANVRVVAARRAYDDATQCVFCLDNDRSIMFGPCRHRVTCGPCADFLSKCPTCRGELESRTTVIG